MDEEYLPVRGREGHQVRDWGLGQGGLLTGYGAEVEVVSNDLLELVVH